MTTDEPYVLVPRSALDLIGKSEMVRGDLSLHWSLADDVYVVDRVQFSETGTAPVAVPKEYEALARGDRTHAGQWARVESISELHALHRYFAVRPGVAMPLDFFRERVKGVQDPGGETGFLMTLQAEVTEDEKASGVEAVVGWAITRNGVRPIQLSVEPEVVGLSQLVNHWPVDKLQGMSVLVVGLGSIGGVAAEELAGYGVGTLHLVDPDRFLWHNIVRHVLGRESVGAYKSVAMKRHLEAKWLETRVHSHTLDVVEDADQIRTLMDDADVIVCAADGIAPRRVVSHLARRANKPAILACVLDNGSVGEVLRFRPGPAFGCLLCQRAHLQEHGSIDAEADQELDYGTGLVHRPMTAVGPDLHAIGILAAKEAVATHLEFSHGDHTQRLPGEYAIIGLRPGGDLAWPFDIRRTTDVTWHPGIGPRPNCVTCNPT